MIQVSQIARILENDPIEMPIDVRRPETDALMARVESHQMFANDFAADDQRYFIVGHGRFLAVREAKADYRGLRSAMAADY
jgi:hypothetical protein